MLRHMKCGAAKEKSGVCICQVTWLVFAVVILFCFTLGAPDDF